MRRLQVRVGAVLRVAVTVVVERDRLEAVELPHATVAPGVLVDVVAERQHQVGPVVRHVAIGREESLFVVRAGRERELHRGDRHAGGGAGHGAPGGGLVAPDPEPVEILPTRLQPVHDHVHGVREVRARPGHALLRDVRESGILGDFPGHLEDGLAEIGRVERFRRESRPDDETVRSRVARGDAELERVVGEADLGAGASQRNQGECAGGCRQAVELAAGNSTGHGCSLQMPAPCSNPDCTGSACDTREFGGTLCVSQTLPPITLPRPTVTRPSTVALA